MCHAGIPTWQHFHICASTALPLQTKPANLIQNLFWSLPACQRDSMTRLQHLRVTTCWHVSGMTHASVTPHRHITLTAQIMASWHGNTAAHERNIEKHSVSGKFLEIVPQLPRSGTSSRTCRGTCSKKYSGHLGTCSDFHYWMRLVKHK